MTSIERHEARYQRRKTKREQKRYEFVEQYLNERNTFGTLPFIQSAKNCKRGTNWKPSVQAYNANVVINSRRSSVLVMSDKWKTKGFHEFDIIERGKPRHIRSVNFEERCIQRSLCDNCLTPILSHYLIYDNGATLANKGTDFALNRFTDHLHKFYRKYERNGYIFFFDFSKYFENINISKLKTSVDKYLPHGLHKIMYHRFIDVFKHDGLGLGSQVSQISAVFFANKLDHFIKDQLGEKYFARYMDDGYIICHDLDKLKYIITKIEKICSELGIILNKKKCQIIPLHKQFRFLKIKFFMTKTGKVVKRLDKQVTTKERRKLRKFKQYLLNEKMSELKLYNMFHCWLYSQKRGKNFNVLRNMIAYYNNLFTPYVLTKPKKSKRLAQYHTLKYICKYTKAA